MTIFELAGRNILVTGHTGFKGSWLSLWLTLLGANVHGVALDPAEGSLFDRADIGSVLASDHRIDVRDLSSLQSTFRDIAPDAVMHLAAQPLVRDSYLHPVETFATNVMGTVHTLIAAMATPSVRAALIVTTDKVYRNIERTTAYRENDPLGGDDPYSASKACAEIATHALEHSRTRHDIRISTVRSGNVLGGGDMAKDRLLPDLIRSFRRGEQAVLRYPEAVRPWQHVLDPLHGYIRILERQLSGRTVPPLNLGSDPNESFTVRQVAEAAALAWGKSAKILIDSTGDHPHEAGLLLLDSTRALSEIGWRSLLSGREAVDRTVAWHRDVDGGLSPRAAMRRDLDEFGRLMDSQQ